MSDESALRARLQTWIEEHGRSARSVSIEAGLSENTVGRYLEGATKRLRPENWTAICGAIGWDVGLTLADAGYVPMPTAPADTAGQIDRLLQQAGVGDAARGALMQLIRLVLAQGDSPSGAPPGPLRGASPTTHSRS